MFSKILLDVKTFWDGFFYHLKTINFLSSKIIYLGPIFVTTWGFEKYQFEIIITPYLSYKYKRQYKLFQIEMKPKYEKI